MLPSGNTSPCHDPLHLFAKTAESQHAGIAQQLSDRALRESRDFWENRIKWPIALAATIFAIVEIFCSTYVRNGLAQPS